MTLAGWGSQLLGIENDSRAYSDAENEYFVSRYGSVKGFRDAMIQDPAGVAADLSLFVSVTNLALRTGLRAGSISSAVKIPAKIESGLIVGSKYLDEFSSVLDPLTPLGKEVARIMSKTQVKEIQDILRIIEEHGGIASRIKTSLGVAGTQGAIENNKKR